MAKGDITFSHGRYWKDRGDGTADPMPIGYVPKPKAGRKIVDQKQNRGRGGVVATAVSAPASGGIISSRRRVPSVSSNGVGTIVKNTEAFIDINSAALGAFSVSASAIIPTTPSWLAGLADLYSKYRWKRLRFVYIPGCPTSTQGNAAVSIAYDRLDASPASLVAMQQSYRALTFPPYAGFDGAMALQTFNNVAGMVVMDVDVSRVDKNWYPVIAPAALAALPANIQNPYVPATLYTGSVNGPAVATYFGTFYIQYEIEFIEPVNPTQNA